MALATQCPFCQTTFRVANDQLKLRDGLVRCGACKEIFNGNDHLVPSGITPDNQTISATPATAASLTSPYAVDNDAKPIATQLKQASAPIVPPHDLSSSFASIAAETKDAPWGIMDDKTDADSALLIEETTAQTTESHQPFTTIPQEITAFEQDTLDDHVDTVDDHQDEELEALEESEYAYDTPGFVEKAERQQRFSKVLKIIMGIGAVLLTITLLTQAIYLWRNPIAAWLPSTRPLLSSVCSLLHCRLGLPTEIDQLSLESSELQLVPPNQDIYTLTLLLRNRSHSTQTWPYIELTLNDDNEQAIMRRVFTPDEYLDSPQQIKLGLNGTNEQQIKLFFELKQAPASGYRLYLFYP